MRGCRPHEQHYWPAAADGMCQLLACASQPGGKMMARRPLLARSSVLIRQHGGRLYASWLASPSTTFKPLCRRPQGCRHQSRGAPGKVTAVADTERSVGSESKGFSTSEKFRLKLSERGEYRARVAERKARAQKPPPGSPMAEAAVFLLRSPLSNYVKDQVLMLGLAAYLDLSDIIAKMGYNRDWEATEVPLDCFQQGIPDEVIPRIQQRWLEGLYKMSVRPPRENRFKKKSEAEPKGSAGAAAPKGFGGAEAKPSRGRKRKGAGPAAKKTVKSKGELLYELEMKQRAQERERQQEAQQEAWNKYVADLESYFGPLTDEEAATYNDNQMCWDMAHDIFNLAVGPFLDASDTCGSMETAVRLLRSLRFACVVSMPIVRRRQEDKPEAPRAEQVSGGQRLLSGVGTALRDALSFRNTAAAASDPEAAPPADLGLTLEDVRKLGQHEHDQGLLDQLEVVDRAGAPAEAYQADTLGRDDVIGVLLTPGYLWWIERAERARAEVDGMESTAAADLSTDVFPEDMLLGGEEMPDSPIADVSGSEMGDDTDNSTGAHSAASSESAQPSGQSIEALEASRTSIEQPAGVSQQAAERDELSEPSAEATQASSEFAAEAAQPLQETAEQALEPSEAQPDMFKVSFDSLQQSPLAASQPSPEHQQSASEAATPPEQSSRILEQQGESQQHSLRAPEQAEAASSQSPASQKPSVHASDQVPSEAAKASEEGAGASAGVADLARKTLQPAEEPGGEGGPPSGRQLISAQSLSAAQQAQEVSKAMREPRQRAEGGQGPASHQGESTEDSRIEHSADAAQSSQPQPLSHLADRFRDTATELAQLDASAMGPRARRPPAARSRNTRSRDGWTSLPEHATEPGPERQAAPVSAPAIRPTSAPVSAPAVRPMSAPVSAPAVRPTSTPSPQWQPRIRVQPPAFQEGAYMAPQLLPGDRREWKAAGVLAFTVDRRGVHLLLGKIDQRLSYSVKWREEGWWILGGKRSGADYSAEATAVREMFEETAGLLSGRDVSGGQLAEVLWFPNAGYALFPLYIPGKPSIPRAYSAKMAERERIRRRSVRRAVAGPRPMSVLGWVSLKAIMERRCKLHMVLEAMLRNTPLVAYLQQMEQLLGEEAALQANPVTYPRGAAAYRSPPPAVPRAFPVAPPGYHGGDSGLHSRGRPQYGEGPSAGRWARAPAEPRHMARPARMHPSALHDIAAPPPQASSAAQGAASANGSAADEQGYPAALTAAAAGPAASGGRVRLAEARLAEAEDVGSVASNVGREGVPHPSQGASGRELAEHAARAAGSSQIPSGQGVEDVSSEAQRSMQPWERELNAPKPYKPATIGRGRRRLKRRSS